MLLVRKLHGEMDYIPCYNIVHLFPSINRCGSYIITFLFGCSIWFIWVSMKKFFLNNWCNLQEWFGMSKLSWHVPNAGGTTEPGSGSSDESGCSSRKRARKDGHGSDFFDLNLPADADRTDLWKLQTPYRNRCTVSSLKTHLSCDGIINYGLNTQSVKISRFMVFLFSIFISLV